MADPTDSTAEAHGFKAITAMQWQALGILFGAGTSIIAVCAWLIYDSPDDFALRRAAAKGLALGCGFIVMGLLAVRNFARVMRHGQSTLCAPPTETDRLAGNFLNNVFPTSPKGQLPAGDGSEPNEQ
jgi:hypothetical protein